MEHEPTLISLGNGRERTDTLRQGTLCFASRRGLAPATRLLVEALPEDAPKRALIGRDRSTALALAAHRLWPETEIVEHHHDAFVAGLARKNLENNHARITSVLGASLPAGPFGFSAMPFEAGGDSLVARDMLEAAHDALEVGGVLLAGTDGKHTWLQEAVEHVFRNARAIMAPEGRGAVIRAERRSGSLRHKDRRHAITVVHRERSLAILTCPGVFSYGRLDRGTKALLEVGPERSEGPLLDLGCGPGSLGIALAPAAGAGTVLVDSDARAIACAQENLKVHGLHEACALLRGDLEDLPTLDYRLAVANPPYYGDGRIANSFAARAAGMLHPDGRLLMVARDERRHGEILHAHFTEVEAQKVGEYTVFTARKARQQSSE
jgi:16S rRNA (guanine1207-N2)-methyltransferase